MMSQDGRIYEYEFGDFRVRTDDLALRHRGVELALAPKVVRTLIAMLERPRVLVTKEALMRSVWGDAPVEEANLTQNVYSLRREFKRAAGDPLIETLPRRGYRFTAEVVKRAAGTSRRTPVTARTSQAWLATAAASLVTGALTLAVGYPSAPAQLAPAAQRAYDLGWFYWRGDTPTSVRAGIAQFDRVIAATPQSPLGYAAAAVCYAKLSDLESSAQAVADADAANRLADESVALDARSPMALAARGFVEWDLDADNDGAVADLAASVAADPTIPVARMWYGNLLMWRGEASAAHRQLQLAADADPTLPGIDYAVGFDDYLLRDYPDAAAYAKIAIGDPWTAAESHLLLAAAYDEEHRFGAAIGALQTMSHVASTELAVSGTLAHVYASMGERARARAELARVERLSTEFQGRPVLTAVAYAANGLPDEAFAWLSRLPAADRAAFALDPRFDTLHGDPRFKRWLHG